MRNGIYYKCDDCGREATIRSYKKAREMGWAVGKDYSNCWCPVHAPAHRKGNAKLADLKARKKLQRIMQIGIKERCGENE